MWEPQVKFFKDNFRVITPDLPGFGKSNKVKSYKSIKSIANLLLDCLESKKINKFHLLGHSMGGMIAQEMAKKREIKFQNLFVIALVPEEKCPVDLKP